LSVALTPANMLFCFLVALMGTLAGVLPGLGPSAAISLLLPSTFHADPTSSMIMLAGVYYGEMYGGSTTSILVNIQGAEYSIYGIASDNYSLYPVTSFCYLYRKWNND